MRNIFTINAQEYHNLITKQDKTKEEARRLEVIKHQSICNGLVRALENLSKLTNEAGENIVNILEYDNVTGLYRIQVVIKGKLKTIARIKVGKRDCYVLVRETTAKELNKSYELINYNLPAGYYIQLADAFKEFRQIVEYHYSKQTA